jgi:RHS repeat-associated protein
MHRFISFLSLLVLFPALLLANAYVSYEGTEYAEIGRDQIEGWMIGGEGEGMVEEDLNGKKITPERMFLERLMTKIPEYRQARKDRMKTRPSPFKAGWRGGSEMGEASAESKRPERRSYLYLRGDVLMMELINLRAENTTASQLFPDVSRHLAKASEELKGQSPQQILNAVLKSVDRQTPHYDYTPPSLTITAPADGDEIHTKEPMIEVIYGDHQTGLNLDSLKIWVNGVDRTSRFTIDDLRAIWYMESPDTLIEGENIIEASIKDHDLNERSVSSTFDVVTEPPPDDEHFVNGYVLDGDMFEPLEGVAVTVQGITGVIYTDSSGHYVFPTPGLGEYQLDITKDGYTYAQRSLLIENGHGDAFVDDAYLSPRDNIITRIPKEDGGIAINSDGSVVATFPPGILEEDIDVSAFNLDEQEDLPAPLPKLSVFTYCVKFWPDAVEFSDSAFVDQLNSRGFESETPIPIGHYNPETMEWEDEGMAYVGSDSTWFEYSSKHFMSWYDCNDPVQERPEPDTNLEIINPDVCNGDQSYGSPVLGTTKLKFGGSLIYHQLPVVYSYGVDQSLSFTYASYTVQPKIVIETGTLGTPDSLVLPVYTGVQLDLVGRRFTGIIESSRDTTRQRIRFDGKDASGSILPTGHYYLKNYLTNFNFSPYSIAECFGCPPVDSTNVYTDFPVAFIIEDDGDFMIDNRVSSEFGSGWAINGIQRIHFRPDGCVLITEGGAASHFYNRTYYAPILDLAVTSASDNIVSILMGDGLGGFGYRQDWSAGEHPSGVIGADFNGDLNIDLAIANTGDDNVSVLLGNGVGGFGIRQDWQVGTNPRAIVSGDFDSDTNLDLMVTNINIDSVSILLGDGEGSFGNYQAWAVGEAPRNIVVGDFDNDLDLDVATANYKDDNVSVLQGDGAGGFMNRQDWPVGDYPDGAIGADFNGDLNIDLAITNPGTDDVSILLGDGTGNFGNRRDWPVGGNPKGLTTGDFDGDLDLDLAIANNSFDSVSILHGDGSGGFNVLKNWPVGHWAGEIVAGDFDGDQDLDLAVTNHYDDDISILLNDGTGGFRDRQDFPVGDYPNWIIADNLNGDYYMPGFHSQEGDFTTLIINPDSSSYARIYPDSSKVVFDSTGLHIATIDRNSNTTTYEYDESDRLISVTAPGSLVTSLVYGHDSYLDTVIDPVGRITCFEHDSVGNLISVLYPDSSIWQYEYDSDHPLTKVVDPRGNETGYVYDENGYVTQIAGPDSSMNDFLASDSYNTLNEAIELGYGTPENPAEVVRPSELINLFVNTLGDSTTSHTNAYGRKTRKVDPLGRIHRWEYDEDGNVTAMVRPDSTRVSFTYDEFGNPLTVVEESIGATTSVVYDSVFHLPIQIEDAEGHVTKIDRDSRGNPVKIINALNDTTFNTFDSQGLLTKTINPLGDLTLFDYNQLGRLIKVINPLGRFTQIEYDTAGNVKAVIDANNYRTEHEYNSMNMLKLTRDNLGNETRYQYDENSNLTELVNAKGDTTHFAYDEYNRRISTIDPLDHTEKFVYNTEGMLINSINANGDTVKNVYDEVHRLTKKILPDDMTEYEYDLVGNLTRVEDSDSRLIYGYDDARRLISVETGNTSNPAIIQPLVNLDYLRDLNGNIIQRVDSEGDTIFYGYDSLDRLSVIQTNGDSTAYSYNAAGWLESQIHSNGTVSDYTYDIAGQLLDLTHTLSSDTIAFFSYQYDSVGNRTSMTDLDGFHEYTYDSLYQIVGATHPQVFNPTEYYAYDALGNRDSSHLSTSYSFDACNRLMEDDDYEYGWDNTGRQIWKMSKTNGDTTHFEYTVEDQMVRVYNDSLDVRFAYDGAANRIQKTVISNSGTDTLIVKFSYDGADLLFEYDGFDFLQVRYLYGPGIDNILETSDTAGVHLFFSDGLGSVASVTDTSGVEVRNQTYDTFGNIVSSSGNAPGDRVSYTGREWDEELGLYYYRARYNSLSNGRFVSKDPLGYLGGANYYTYVSNNPITWSDPFGLLGCLWSMLDEQITEDIKESMLRSAEKDARLMKIREEIDKLEREKQKYYRIQGFMYLSEAFGFVLGAYHTLAMEGIKGIATIGLKKAGGDVSFSGPWKIMVTDPAVAKIELKQWRLRRKILREGEYYWEAAE